MFVIKVTRYTKNVNKTLNDSKFFNFIGRSYIDNCRMYELNKTYTRMLKINKILQTDEEIKIKNNIESMLNKIKSNVLIMLDDKTTNIEY